MKWSPLLHGISAVIGFLGAFSIVGAWLAGADGTFMGFSQVHLFSDATVLLLLSVSAGIGTLIHQNQEK